MPAQSDPLPRKRLTIAFTHHRLGIGGAEQLVLLAAYGLQNQGHTVHLYTTYHQPDQSLALAHKVLVKVHGQWIPRTLFGTCQALMAIIRMLWLWLCILFCGISYDVIINDQVSAINPLLRCVCSKLVFYCHYPDLLLTTRSETLLYKFYRRILNRIEAFTIGRCDCLFVNSQYTADTLQKTFPTFRSMKVEVLYPPVILPNSAYRNMEGLPDLEKDQLYELMSSPFFVSINRYERKKGISLAIEALKIVHEKYSGKEAVKLVIAGGYESHSKENVEYLKELQGLVVQNKIHPNDVIFLRSISDETRSFLISTCTALLYTPQNEHFGMVPCEAMIQGGIVIAANSGGPKETVVHGETGLLCAPTALAFSEAMLYVLDLRGSNPYTLQRMAECSVKRAEQFNLESFVTRLEHSLVQREDTI